MGLEGEIVGIFGGEPEGGGEVGAGGGGVVHLSVDSGEEEVVEVGVGEIFEDGIEGGAVGGGECGGFGGPALLLEGGEELEGEIEVFGVERGELEGGGEEVLAVILLECEHGLAEGGVAREAEVDGGVVGHLEVVEADEGELAPVVEGLGVMAAGLFELGGELL